MATTATLAGDLNASPQGMKRDKKEEKNALRRKYEYPPANYEAPLGTLRVHSSETFSARSAGRVLQEWSFCVKPRSEPNNGCRMGRFGYLVWHQGVLRKAIWVSRPVCDYEGSEGEDGEQEELFEDSASGA